MELDIITYGVFKTLGEVGLATGTILGLTGLAGKLVPEKRRDTVLPVLACILGVGIAYAFQISHGDAVSLVGGMVGVVFGGAVTGLYSVAKDIKKA